jgi:hypothetical protein
MGAHDHSREVPFDCFAVDMREAEHDACTPLGSVSRHVPDGSVRGRASRLVTDISQWQPIWAGVTQWTVADGWNPPRNA